MMQCKFLIAMEFFGYLFRTMYVLEFHFNLLKYLLSHTTMKILKLKITKSYYKICDEMGVTRVTLYELH